MNVNQDTRLATCLKQILDRRGESLLRDSRLLQSLLADLAPSDVSPWQVRAAVFVVQQGIASQLWKQREALDARRFQLWTAELENAFGLSRERAEWALRCWIDAIGIPDPTGGLSEISTLEPANAADAGNAISEADIRVDVAGRGDFAFLVDALESATAGATIHLLAGVHRLKHGVVIRQPVTILGQGMDATEIVTDLGDFVLCYEGVDHFGLQDLTVRWRGDTPESRAAVVQSGHVDIARVRFTGAVSGVELRGDSRGFVRECVIEGNCHGITVSGAGHPTLVANICRDNTLSGIGVAGEAQPALEGNICERNQQSGIAYFANAGGTARNNTCRGNAVYGFKVSNKAQPTLEGNTCERNQRSGIAYFDNAGGTARSNTCRENLSGIALVGEAQPTLEGNTCERGRHSGIIYFASAGGTARNNTCRRNAFFGIALVGEAQPTLEGNICERNQQSGIAYFANAGGTARNNTCRDNITRGIYIEASASPRLERNDVRHNQVKDVDDRRPWHRR